MSTLQDCGCGMTVPPEDCDVAILTDDKSRTDLLNRLKRAEGQLRGIQRMIEEGQPCLDIASQMAAVRKALDSTYVRMTVCFMEQELGARLGPDTLPREQLAGMLDDMQTLLGKVR
jgi:DNA-binding FrmR family transcriptional regulator